MPAPDTAPVHQAAGFNPAGSWRFLTTADGAAAAGQPCWGADGACQPCCGATVGAGGGVGGCHDGAAPGGGGACHPAGGPCWGAGAVVPVGVVGADSAGGAAPGSGCDSC